ncbi:MAG: rod shape-determining protein MreC [Veillonella sp.]|nr:rod shape-determining protein MreC [Veillonella sp.]
MYTSDRKLVIVVLVTLVLVAVLGYAWKQRTTIPFVTVPLERVLTPFLYGANEGVQHGKTGIAIIDNTLGLLDNQAELEAKIAAMEQEKVNADEILAENVRLRQMLNYQQQNTQFAMQPARVIVKDYGTWTNTMIIDKGSNDGIQVNMAVVVPSGVVGVVTDVYPDSARVETIVDPRSAVGVIVQRPESRVASVLKGNGSTPSEPTMVDIAKDGDVLIGDTLVTSGYGGVFPKGLLVGHVTKLTNDPEGFVKNATVETTVNFRKVEEVFVILRSTAGQLDKPKVEPKLVPQTQRDQVEGAKGAVNQ